MVLSLTGCVSLTRQCVLESAILGGTFFIAAKGFITVDYQSIMKGMGLIAICVFFSPIVNSLGLLSAYS